jgi:hypothetical protein
MHGAGGRLKIEERGVEPAQPLHGPSRSIEFDP